MVFSNKRNGFIFILIITFSILFSFYTMHFGWSELYSNENLDELRLSDEIYESCSNLRYNFAEIKINVSNNTYGYFNSSVQLLIENKGNQEFFGLLVEMNTNGGVSIPKKVVLDNPLNINDYELFKFNSYLNCETEVEGCKINSINIIPKVKVELDNKDEYHTCDNFKVHFSRDDISVDLETSY